MSTYEYIPVNEQFERSNFSILSSSPMFEGRVNPMFPSKLIIRPCVFILMIDIGSSPERIQNSVKTYKKTSHVIVLVRFYWGTQAYAIILKASKGEEGWVPVSFLMRKFSSFKFANWPNSAGMGPGVYKTQSNHTKTKSRHRTGAKAHKIKQAFSFILNASQGKRKDGVPVSWL